MCAEVRRKRLGEILIDQGMLTMPDLNRALDIQKEEGGLIGAILLRHKMVKEEDLVIALATQFNYPYLSVESYAINAEAIRAVPAELVRKHLFIPVDKAGNFLTVVMADPSNDAAIAEIEKESGCKVQAFLGTVTEIETAIHRQYKISASGAAGDEKAKMTLRQASEKKMQEGG